MTTGNALDITFLANQLLYASSATTLAGLITTANGVLITSGAGVPSISQTLPAAVQANITGTGALVSGSLAPGFTIVSPVLGGTGVNNGASTITLAGSLTTVGAFPATFNFTGATNVTFPTAGTLATTAGTVSSVTASSPLASSGGTTPNITLNSVVPLNLGGTFASLVASNGGIVWSNATQMQILAGTATANQLLLSGASATPSWSTSTYPTANAINTLLYASAANVMSALATGNNGVLVTGGTGIPSISTTIPAATQANITAVGALAAGSLAAGFTTVTVPLGGTGDVTFTAYAPICGGTTATGNLQSIASVGTAGQVLTSNGAGALPSMQNLGAVALQVNSLCNFRLTLTTLTPVTTADVLAATTVYWSPYKGNYISLYNVGSAVWANFTSAEINIAVPATTSTAYDVFVGLSGGVPALSLIAWTNITTRATALALQNGVLVSSGNAALRYVGSFATTTVSGQTQDAVGGRYLYNYYNRVSRYTSANDATASWNYTTATYRQANANTANKLTYFIGVAEDNLHAEVNAIALGSMADTATVGVGINSTTVNSALSYGAQVNTATYTTIRAVYNGLLPIGLNSVSWLEWAGASGVVNWQGTNAGSQFLSGITGFQLM